MNKTGFSPSVSLDYEPTHNIYYIQIYPTIEKNSGFGSKKSSYVDSSKVSNIAIYDVVTNTTSYLFEEDKSRNILLFLFEKEFNVENKNMVFNIHSGNIINNQKIKERLPNNSLLILIQNKEKETLEFWSADKKGTNKTLIKTISQKITWKLDVYNQKLFFIKQLEDAVEIDATNWL